MTNLFLLIIVLVKQQGTVEVLQDERNYTTLAACEAAGAQVAKDLKPRTRYAVTGCVAVPMNLINTI